MNAAELKTIRESLNLSMRDFAEIMEVNERTVRYWESGKTKIPEGVSNWLDNMNRKVTKVVLYALKQISENKKNNKSKICLFRYRNEEDYKSDPTYKTLNTFKIHSAVIGRICNHVAQDDVGEVELCIEFYDKDCNYHYDYLLKNYL